MPRPRIHTLTSLQTAIAEAGYTTRTQLKHKAPRLYDSARRSGWLDILLPTAHSAPKPAHTREMVAAAALKYRTRRAMQAGPDQWAYRVGMQHQWYDVLPPLRELTHVYVLCLAPGVYKVGASANVRLRVQTLGAKSMVAAMRVANGWATEKELLAIGNRPRPALEAACWPAGAAGVTELRAWSPHQLQLALGILAKAAAEFCEPELPDIF